MIAVVTMAKAPLFGDTGTVAIFGPEPERSQSYDFVHGSTPETRVRGTVGAARQFPPGPVRQILPGRVSKQKRTFVRLELPDPPRGGHDGLDFSLPQQIDRPAASEANVWID